MAHKVRKDGGTTMRTCLISVVSLLAVGCNGEMEKRLDSTDDDVADATAGVGDVAARVAALELRAIDAETAQEATEAALAAAVTRLGVLEAAHSSLVAAHNTLVAAYDTTVTNVNARFNADEAAHDALVASYNTTVSNYDARFTANEVDITDIYGRLRNINDESMFVWDGAGRYMGAFAGVIGSSTAFIDPVRQMLVLAGAMNVYFRNADCTGAAYVSDAGNVMIANPQPNPVPATGVLNQASGNVLLVGQFLSSGDGALGSYMNMRTGICVAASGSTGGGWVQLLPIPGFSPYAPGLEIMPALF